MENGYIFRNEERMEKIEREWKEIWQINDNGEVEQGILWDSMKAIIRGLSIKEASILKKQKSRRRKR